MVARTFTSSRTILAGAADPHDPHHEESFEEFTARYEQEFENVQDSFELQVRDEAPSSSARLAR